MVPGGDFSVSVVSFATVNTGGTLWCPGDWAARAVGLQYQDALPQVGPVYWQLCAVCPGVDVGLLSASLGDVGARPPPCTQVDVLKHVQ